MKTLYVAPYNWGRYKDYDFTIYAIYTDIEAVGNPIWHYHHYDEEKGAAAFEMQKSMLETLGYELVAAQWEVPYDYFGSIWTPDGVIDPPEIDY